jgi:uncharacterized protein YfaP (DUF2135 family)
MRGKEFIHDATRLDPLPEKFAAVVLLMLLPAALAPAQETRGTIFGTVRDASGGVLPGITVVVTSEAMNLSNEAVTNARGSFEFPYLLPGDYTVVVQADGFKKFRLEGFGVAPAPQVPTAHQQRGLCR